MGRVLGHVKQSYMFDLLLETRMPHERFYPYKPGGKLRKVHTFVSADTFCASHKAWFKPRLELTLMQLCYQVHN